MAVVKITKFTRTPASAKAHIRYIQHRKGKDGQKVRRELFGFDGSMERVQAYELIDAAGKGTVFFRIAISPDPATEDRDNDLCLPELTAQTMLALEERLGREVPFVAAEHNDHAPHRHVHVLACVRGRVNPPDLQVMRATATQGALEQRQERDLAREQQQSRQTGQEGLQRGGGR
jgi:hypothetical protein